MAAKLCNVCNTRRAYTGSGPGVDIASCHDMCNLCYTEGGWENTHSDDSHDANNVDDMCWICVPALNLAQRPARTGHRNTVAKTRTSHRGCGHAATPQDRATCRATRTWNGQIWS